LASYLFYGWWDWRFLILVIISSLTDYFIGIKLENTKEERGRKYLKYLSLFVNLGFLGIFKYYNFFIDSFAEILQIVGLNPSIPVLNVLLPVGISFYTFQTIGYTLDVYKRKYKAEKDLVNFMVYVCFFPQLVAGPIERGRNLLPQFRKERVFSRIDASDGLRQILIGLFKKVVIADNLANGVNYAFSNYTEHSSLTLIFGGLFFMIQVYCDFAGYSDIAIGTAKLFGFKLMKNFDFPFYTSNAQEFWTRWHISLSNWFRDYVLFGMKSSFKSRKRFALNFLFSLTIIGFWHGANWTFIIFGFLNGLYIMPSIIWRNKIKKVVIPRDTLFPTLIELVYMGKTFVLFFIPTIFFRSPNVTFAIDYFKHMFINSNGLFPSCPSVITSNIFWFALPLLIEWPLRNRDHSLDIANVKKPIRWAIYIILILIMINYGEFQHNQFIYFQF
jgi:D-alanyl-lipoteichoic acid acyltransferase DltB (MBOAT superfamily)